MDYQVMVVTPFSNLLLENRFHITGYGYVIRLRVGDTYRGDAHEG